MHSSGVFTSFRLPRGLQGPLVVFFVLGITIPLFGQGTARPRVVERFGDLHDRYHFSKDTTYVVNFWATWCKPCVKELPYFEALNQDLADSPVRLLLVSLDFPNQVDSRLVPFLQSRAMTSEVLVLTDPDANNWIPRVADEWSGALPATLVIRNDHSCFREGDFESQPELLEFIRNCNNTLR